MSGPDHAFVGSCPLMASVRPRSSIPLTVQGSRETRSSTTRAATCVGVTLANFRVYIIVQSPMSMTPFASSEEKPTGLF
jgi:hypothetical protein